MATKKLYQVCGRDGHTNQTESLCEAYYILGKRVSRHETLNCVRLQVSDFPSFFWSSNTYCIAYSGDQIGGAQFWIKAVDVITDKE